MKVYGTWVGIRKSKEALQYYDGLARGKRNLYAYGLIDSQLKADGHPGIWPERTDTSETDYTEQANIIFAPAEYEGSTMSYNQLILDQDDIYAYQEGTTSPWDLPENISPFLTDGLEADFSLNLFGDN